MYSHEPNDQMKASSGHHSPRQDCRRRRRLPRRIPPWNNTTALFTLWLLLALVIPGETANETAAPSSSSPLLCACQPAAYEIALDFNISCDDSDIDAGSRSNPGINATACITRKETDQNVTDFTPVIVHTIQFIEHNEFVNPIQQVPLNGEFLNGDVVMFTSVLATNETANFTEYTIPRTLQVILRGSNAEDQDIQLIWIIKYSNSCETVPPIIVEGQTMGWSEFVGLQDPPSSVCPALRTPSSQPTSQPSQPSTLASSPSTPPSPPPLPVPTKGGKGYYAKGKGTSWSSSKGEEKSSKKSHGSKKDVGSIMGMSLSVSLKKMMDQKMSHWSSSSSAKGEGSNGYYTSTSLDPTSLPSIMGEGGGDGSKGKGGMGYKKQKKSKSYQGKGASSMMMRLR